jgi:hypothetical protein
LTGRGEKEVLYAPTISIKAYIKREVKKYAK